MIWVPGGVFKMGSDQHYPEEQPVHRVKVDGFWIDRTPVTDREFRRFVEATGYVTFAEIAPDPKDYPGALPRVLRAGSLVFTPPRRAVDLRDWSNWWKFKFGAVAPTVIRRAQVRAALTSLSLISFGFTIYQVFNKLKEAGTLTGAAPARNFGMSLILVGIGMVVFGIVYHILFMLGLREQREEMRAAGLIHAQSKFPTSLTLIVALALLAIGCVAVLGLVLRVGPFG